MFINGDNGALKKKLLLGSYWFKRVKSPPQKALFKHIYTILASPRGQQTDLKAAWSENTCVGGKLSECKQPLQIIFRQCGQMFASIFSFK